MLQVVGGVSSCKKRANVIPIQTVLILVILLSYTYYLPPREGKKRERTRGVKLQTQPDVDNVVSMGGETVVQQFELHTKALFFFFFLSVSTSSQALLMICSNTETPRSSSSDLREILSITECGAAQASHICPIKIRNGPVCSALIRFLPAETAIIFLSLGFSCGRAVLHTCPMHKAARLFFFFY